MSVDLAQYERRAIEAESLLAQLQKRVAALEKTSSNGTPVVEISKGSSTSKLEEEQDGKEKGKLSLKTPKGTRDYDPLQMSIRDYVFDIIKAAFKRHGAVQIETPIFELKETLTGKYGEDSKLIYDLKDQGGEICALRYDLTVPFARYCATNRVKNIKRYQIGRVYRRDQPVMTKGRYREFYQCDFDIAGEYDLMVPDSEALALMSEILTAVNVGTFIIKLNHRKLLDCMFDIVGVPKDKFRTISSSVDKLDKTPWDEVEKEMIEKGLTLDITKKIQEFVKLNGHPFELLALLRSRGLFANNKEAEQTLSELELLFKYVDAYGVLDKIHFDLSLARGLDYYTGVIYEAVLTESGVQVGSISAGGRYDGLIGMFGGTIIPAVGFSVGVERIFALLESKAAQASTLRETETEVMIVSIGKELIIERMKLLKELWSAGIKAEMLYKVSPKPQAQLNHADAQRIPFALVFGEDELKAGNLQLKYLQAEQQAKDNKTNQETISRSNMISILKDKIEAWKRAKKIL